MYWVNGRMNRRAAEQIWKGLKEEGKIQVFNDYSDAEGFYFEFWLRSELKGCKCDIEIISYTSKEDALGGNSRISYKFPLEYIITLKK